jgi:hypothetical protein
MLLASGGGTAAGALIGTGVGIAAGMSSATITTAAVMGGGAATTTTTAVLNATGGDPTDEIKAFGNLSKAAEYGVQKGSELKNAISGTGLKVHHIIEQRLAPALGQTSSQAKHWLSTAVTKSEHQDFTNAWRSAIGYSNQAME